MRILTLGNSSEAGAWLPMEQRRYVLAAKRLSERLGEPVEPVFRRCWPTPDFPARVERFLEQDKPDLVVLRVPAGYVCIESVPLKFERRFGRAGRKVAAAGVKSSGIRWLAFNPVYRGARWSLKQVVGGATYFTPGEVLESIDGALRVIGRREGVGIVVEGPAGIVHFGVTGRERARSEGRRMALHQPLAELCQKYHIEYIGYGTAVNAGGVRNRLGDATHGNAVEHAERAETDVAAILRVLERQRG